MYQGDEELQIAEICRWDDKSMGLLYDNFYRAVVAYAYQFVDADAAEDIVQEVFFALWKHQPVFPSVAYLSAYLYKSVHNTAINYVRRQDIREDYRKNLVKNPVIHDLPEDESEVFNKEEIYRQLFLAIDELPPRQREVLLLCMEGKKNREIAELLQISAETVKVQKRRAINSLRNKLSPMALAYCLQLIPV